MTPTTQEFFSMEGIMARDVSGMDRQDVIQKFCIKMAPLNSFCNGEQIGLINAAWKNLRFGWSVMMKRGYYLPEFGSKAITGSYLFGVLCGKVYSFKRINAFRAWTSNPPMKKDLLEAIARAFGAKKFKNRILGWNEDSYPDDQYMLDLLLHLDSNNELFQQAEYKRFTGTAASEFIDFSLDCFAMNFKERISTKTSAIFKLSDHQRKSKKQKISTRIAIRAGKRANISMARAKKQVEAARAKAKLAALKLEEEEQQLAEFEYFADEVVENIYFQDPFEKQEETVQNKFDDGTNVSYSEFSQININKQEPKEKVKEIDGGDGIEEEKL